MTQRFEYRGYQVVCSPISLANGLFNAQALITPLDERSVAAHRLPGVGSFKSAEEAERKGELWARQWIDKNSDPPATARGDADP